MFIHEMSEAECRQLLERTHVGRLACARDNQPYVVPVSFAFNGTCLYGFTTLGQKIEWMRANPLVCFETDEVLGEFRWSSIIVFGRFEELSDTPEHQSARATAHKLLQCRAMWWEPAYMSQQHRDQPHSLEPVFYRIHIAKMTGHRATPNHNGSQPIETQAAPRKRSWMERLLHGEKH